MLTLDNHVIEFRVWLMIVMTNVLVLLGTLCIK